MELKRLSWFKLREGWGHWTVHYTGPQSFIIPLFALKNWDFYIILIVLLQSSSVETLHN